MRKSLFKSDAHASAINAFYQWFIVSQTDFQPHHKTFMSLLDFWKSQSQEAFNSEDMMPKPSFLMFSFKFSFTLYCICTPLVCSTALLEVSTKKCRRLHYGKYLKITSSFDHFTFDHSTKHHQHNEVYRNYCAVTSTVFGSEEKIGIK